MAEWGANPVVKVELTDDQYKDLLDRIVKLGEGRLQSQGKINECDFLAGSMAAMEALGIKCPPWIFMIIGGVKVIMTPAEKEYQEVSRADYKDLALFVGKLRNPKAVALLEKRLKRGS